MRRTTTEKDSAQLHNINVLQPFDAKKFTKEEKKKAIASSIFLTEKEMEQ